MKKKYLPSTEEKKMYQQFRKVIKKEKGHLYSNINYCAMGTLLLTRPPRAACNDCFIISLDHTNSLVLLVFVE
jgi:hypothetical protein